MIVRPIWLAGCCASFRCARRNWFQDKIKWTGGKVAIRGTLECAAQAMSSHDKQSNSDDGLSIGRYLFAGPWLIFHTFTRKHTHTRECGRRAVCHISKRPPNLFVLAKQNCSDSRGQFHATESLLPLRAHAEIQTSEQISHIRDISSGPFHGLLHSVNFTPNSDWKRERKKINRRWNLWFNICCSNENETEILKWVNGVQCAVCWNKWSGIRRVTHELNEQSNTQTNLRRLSPRFVDIVGIISCRRASNRWWLHWP